MKINLKKIIFATFSALLISSSVFASKKTETDIGNKIVDVKAYGFVDLEGAKLSAIIVEYEKALKAKSISKDTYEITDFTIIQEKQNSFDKIIEIDGDSTKGNEGTILKVYVNSKPEPDSKGKSYGKYVIIEVNTSYMMTLQNTIYTTTMIAGVKQVKDIESKNGIIPASDKEFSNYTVTQKYNDHQNKYEDVYEADKSKIILPEFDSGMGWTINRIGDGAFKAANCYSEYTGQYYDFELPYSIYVPNEKTLKKNKGNISLVLHMEHAGANDSDPMSAITSSKAAVKLASPLVQSKNPSIIVVPQIEESRRTTNDFDASSEANPAIWQLIDSILEKYKGCINEDRIYATGQSMGGMAALYMNSQRDNFFAGIAIVGSQWSNNYDKAVQNNGSPARSPENDPVSFNGFGLDKENYQNWYYMISDDNILVHTCAGDPMATGEWKALADYFAACGVFVPYAEWNPYISIDEQNSLERQLVSHDSSTAGSGINWAAFTHGSHMSTWKYGYQLDAPFEWLFKQTRTSENARGKLEQLKNNWLGRNSDGSIIKGSGTAGLNSAQFTPNGASTVYVEGWKPE